LIYIVPLVVIVVLVGMIVFKVKKQRQLLNKVTQYEKLLRDSRVSRYKYQQILQKSRDFFKSQEQVNEGMKIIKSELMSIRSDIRKHLEEIRKEEENSDNSELDKRTITQMKTILGQKLKFLEGRKQDSLKILDKVNGLEKTKKEIIESERVACDKWTKEKNTVMKLWRELNTQASVTNPQKYYS
jgi:heme exporter protein D